VTLTTPFELELGARYSREVGYLPTNFGVSGTLFSTYERLSDGPHDLVTLTFNLGGHGACRCTKFEVRRPSGSEDMIHFR